MLEIGKYHILRVLRLTRVGGYLGDREGNEVLLPVKYTPEGTEVGDALSVFVYRDGEERLVATTLEPKILLHHFACLRVNSVSKFGAFLDWGLEKDLLVPFREQPRHMEEGKSYVVYLYQDEASGRLVASANVRRYLEPAGSGVRPGDEVSVMAWEASPLGMKVIVNQRYQGLVFQSALFGTFSIGETRPGFVYKVREDGKLDISLKKPGHAAIGTEAELLLEKLKTQNGFLALTDHSSPEEISRQLGMSKKSFKKAVGLLYKNRQVRLEKDGVYLT
jgi:predicted RNA-binding protein (virulence factor B family)